MPADLRVYYTKDTEYFVGQGGVQEYPFATSLLDFLYLDLPDDNLTHIYFDALNLNAERKSESIRILQKKIGTLFADVFDALPEGKSILEKLAQYVAAGDGVHFSFSVLSTGFERVESDIFSEVLYPRSIEEIVEFFIRECLRRELRFRRCKSCGKYFALTGYSNTEYCDRLFGDSNKTCKEAGAVRLYRTKIIADPKIQAYNRAYKKRFAWIKYKKISKEAFYEWSERARVQRDRCLANEITLEELEQWLGEN